MHEFCKKNEKDFAMKKIYLFLLPLMALMSCGDSYTENTTENSYIYNGFSVETYDVHIDASDWQYTNFTANGLPYANNYFYCVINMPEITSAVFNKGEVQAYIVYNKHTQQAFKHILPYVQHCEASVNGQWNYFTKTVDCVYGVGWIEFNFWLSDFAYEDNVYINPTDMDFTIAVTTKDQSDTH